MSHTYICLPLGKPLTHEICLGVNFTSIRYVSGGNFTPVWFAPNMHKVSLEKKQARSTSLIFTLIIYLEQLSIFFRDTYRGLSYFSTCIFGATRAGTGSECVFKLRQLFFQQAHRKQKGKNNKCLLIISHFMYELYKKNYARCSHGLLSLISINIIR